MKRLVLVWLLVSIQMLAAQVVIGGQHRKVFGGGSPTASFVQAANCKGAPGVGNCTTNAIVVTSGHTIAFCTGSNGAGTLSSLTISTGTNTLASFTQLFTPISSPSSLDCRYILSTNATGSTTFKATWSVTNAMQMVVYELIVPTGLDAAAPAAQANTTNTVLPCPAYTTTHANAIVMCAAHVVQTEGSNFTASSGFTIPAHGQNVDAVNGGTGAVEYQANVAASTPLSPTITAGVTSVSYTATFAFY